MRRAVCLALLVLMAPPLRPRAQQAPARSPLDLVGTWTLESSEPGTGGPRTLGANLKGLLIFDAAGHIFELVTRATMAQPAGADPPLADQQLRFAMSGGFWGTYRADAQQKTISYQPQGAVNPNMMGRDLTRSFELEGDRLVITYRGGEHYAPAGTRWTFDRVPAVENLSPTYRRVAGFWQHVVEKRLNLTTGVTLSETRRAPSIIVYSPSGYVGVHFPPSIA